MRNRWLLLLGWVLAWCTGPGAAWAAVDWLARLDAELARSERNNTAALQTLLTWRERIAAEAPYAVQREYWMALASVQSDAGQVAATQASLETLRALAGTHQDAIGQTWVEARTALRMVQAGQSNAALVRLEALAPAARALADAQALWAYYVALGNAQLTLGRFEAALESALAAQQQAQALPRQARTAHVRALNFQATIYMAMNNADKALQVLDDALTLAQEVGSSKMQGSLHLNQGATYAGMGRLRDAVRAYEKALAIGRAAGVLSLQGNALNNIGDSYLISKQYPKAEAYAREALEVYRASEDASGQMVARSNLGFALMGQNRVADGAAQVRSALQDAKASGAKGDTEAILGELGRMYEQAGWYREAVQTIREQQALSAELFKIEREKAVSAMQEQFDSVQRQRQIDALARDNRLKDVELDNRRLQQVITLLGALLTVVAVGLLYALYRRARHSNQRLREANEQLRIHAVRDALTGLYNRRSFLDLMAQRAQDVQRSRRTEDWPDGLLLLDVDHFKQINDTHGHAGGDAVLVELAQRLRAAVREGDRVVRWGGEEFLIYSPRCPTERLRTLAQRVLHVVGNTPMALSGRAVTVTVSVGFVSLPFSGLSEAECHWEKTVHLADLALYLAKLHGRNRAYGLGRLNAAAAQALPILEQDLSAAISQGLVEVLEVVPAAAQAPLAPESG